MASSNIQRAHFYEKMSAIRAYCAHHRFPNALSMRVSIFFKYYYEQKSALNENEILNILQGPLRNDVAGHMMKAMLTRVPLFQGLDPGVLSLIVPLLKPVHYRAGDVIVERGAHGTNMYIVRSGEVNIYCTNAWKRTKPAKPKWEGRGWHHALLLGEEGEAGVRFNLTFRAMV